MTVTEQYKPMPMLEREFWERCAAAAIAAEITGALINGITYRTSKDLAGQAGAAADSMLEIWRQKFSDRFMRHPEKPVTVTRVFPSYEDLKAPGGVVFPAISEDPCRPGTWDVFFGPGTSDRSFGSEEEAREYVRTETLKAATGEISVPYVDPHAEGCPRRVRLDAPYCTCGATPSDAPLAENGCEICRQFADHRPGIVEGRCPRCGRRYGLERAGLERTIFRQEQAR
jgi:hypothetical protein